MKNEPVKIPQDFIQERKIVSQDDLFKDPKKFSAIGLDGKFKEKKEFSDFDQALFWTTKRKKISTIGLTASLLLTFILLNETRILEKTFEIIIYLTGSAFGLFFGLIF